MKEHESWAFMMRPKKPMIRVLSFDPAPLYENAKEKTADLQDGLIDYVQDKPLKAVGIAVLTGFILGRLFFRKK